MQTKSESINKTFLLQFNQAPFILKSPTGGYEYSFMDINVHMNV